MSLQIWKTTIDPETRTVVLPTAAKHLSVHTQNGVPCLWSLVKPSFPKTTYGLTVVGTGHDIPEDVGDFVGTFLVENDSLVFHVFEA